MSGTRFQKALQVWHGSPYDWDRPDLSKVGTGEGAQVYGHGFYVGEAQETGKTYMEQTTKRRAGKPYWTFNGDKISTAGLQYDRPEDRALLMLAEDGAHGHKPRGLQSAIKNLRKQSEEFAQRYSPAHGQAVNFGSAADWLEDNQHRFKFNQPGQENTPGRLYELELGLEDHEILDWDEQMKNHHPEAGAKVMQAIGQATGSDPQFMSQGLANWQGHAMYRHLVSKHGSPAKASEALKATGIQAIRYKDAGSRDLKPVVKFDGRELSSSLPDQDEPLAGSIAAWAVNGGHKSVDSVEKFLQDRLNAGRPKEKRYHATYDEYQKTLDFLRANRGRFQIIEPKPTYNYVVFDPSRIRVLRKYGIKGQLVEDLTKSKGPVVLTAQPGRPEED